MPRLPKPGKVTLQDHPPREKERITPRDASHGSHVERHGDCSRLAIFANLRVIAAFDGCVATAKCVVTAGPLLAPVVFAPALTGPREASAARLRCGIAMARNANSNGDRSRPSRSGP